MATVDGYHNGEQLKGCEQHSIVTLVAFKEPRRQSPAPIAAYYLDKFVYDQDKDHYTCPQGAVLTSNGSVYKKSTVCEIRKNPTPYTVEHYKTKACMSCAVKSWCTNNKYGRLVECSKHTGMVGRNNQRVLEQKEIRPW